MTFAEAIAAAAASPTRTFVRPKDWDRTDAWFCFLATTGHWAIRVESNGAHSIKPGWLLDKWLAQEWECRSLEQLQRSMRMVTSPVQDGTDYFGAEVILPSAAGPMGIRMGLKMEFGHGPPGPKLVTSIAEPPGLPPKPKRLKKKAAS